MRKWMKLFLILLGLPKSLYLNLRSFPFLNAIHLPIIVSPFFRIVSTKGTIEISDTDIKFGMIKIGLSGFGLSLHNPCVLQNNGRIVFKGRCEIGGGTRITCFGGVLEIGDGCTFTGDCIICAKKRISIGQDCLISWNTQIMDSDYHQIKVDGMVINDDEEVIISDHVWICSNVTVLKGTKLGRNNVVGSMSLLNREINGDNIVIMGNPPKVVRYNIEWRK